MAWLQGRYATIGQLNTAWGTSFANFSAVAGLPADSGCSYSNPGASQRCQDEDDFRGLVASTYGRIAQQAVREVDSYHLILGHKFAGVGPLTVWGALAPYVDVFSYDIYASGPGSNINSTYAKTGKPFLVAEFSFKTQEADPSYPGACSGPVVANSAARALAYRDFINKVISIPFSVGFSWYKYPDGDGTGPTSCLHGLVQYNDTPNEDFVSLLPQYNTAAEALHQATNGQLIVTNGPPAAQTTTTQSSGTVSSSSDSTPSVASSTKASSLTTTTGIVVATTTTTTAPVMSSSPTTATVVSTTATTTTASSSTKPAGSASAATTANSTNAQTSDTKPTAASPTTPTTP
eukprot:Colp12_sorted_trinity150504_noHs@20897